jgi:hypothetical protein
MRQLTLVLAILAVFSSSLSVVFWRQLHAERGTSDALRAQLEQSEARAATLAAAARAVPAVTQRQVAGSEAKPAEPAEKPAANANSIVSTLLNSNELLKDPEYRKARLAQLRLTLPQSYPGLAEFLGLSADEADKLFALLAENQLEQMSTSLVVGTDGKVDQAQLQERMRVAEQQRAKLNGALASLLGSTRAAQYTQYEQTERSPRMQVANYNRTFESAGMPLSAAQTSAFVEAMKAEQNRQRDDSQAMLREFGPTPQFTTDPQLRARIQEESSKLQIESNRRLADAAAAFLNPRQVEAMRAQINQQAAITRASNRLQREAAAKVQGN